MSLGDAYPVFANLTCHILHDGYCTGLKVTTFI